MANTPKKQDTADDMLAAIEDALRLNEAATSSKPVETNAKPKPASAAPPPPPAADEDIFSDRPAASTRAPLAPREAANDDRPSVGQILAGLNRKPSRFPQLIALALSVVWAGGGYYFLQQRYAEQLAAAPHSGAIYEQAFFLPIVAAVLLPIFGFFVFATLIRRSQEMRYVAAAMTEITMRFAEPEGVSSDAFVSIGQAIRREIAALGDGVERAVARASELESMVKSEVSTLERAYDDNEIRIRALVEGLQSERDAVLSHALRLQEAIVSVQQSFNFDVDGVADRVNASITDATNRIIDNFISQTHSARAHITGAGDEVVQNLLDKSQETADHLNDIGSEIANAVSARGIKTIESLQETTDLMSASIAAKGDAIKEVLIARLQQLEDSIILRGSEVADRVMSDSTSLGTRITQGLAAFDDTVKVHGAEIVQQIRESVDKVNKSSEQNFSNFDSRLVAKTHELAETLDQRIGRVEKTLSDRTQSLNETLATRTLEYARTVAEGAKNAQESVDKTVAGMGEYFTTKAQEIAHTISERTDAINQVLGSRALEMTQGLDTRVARFEEMVVGRLEGITNSIEQKSIAAADALSTKIEGTTRQLRDEAASVEKSFTQLADQVSQTLVSRAREVTGAHERLQGDVTGVLERLNDANAMLKTVLDGIVENLGPDRRGRGGEDHRLPAGAGNHPLLDPRRDRPHGRPIARPARCLLQGARRRLGAHHAFRGSGPLHRGRRRQSERDPYPHRQDARRAPRGDRVAQQPSRQPLERSGGAARPLQPPVAGAARRRRGQGAGDRQARRRRDLPFDAVDRQAIRPREEHLERGARTHDRARSARPTRPRPARSIRSSAT